ncbi:MAG: aminoacetone oxidase family FAD-binding enzyme [Lachnospiraceae bacterium]|nr:aminoacetone oxidase family FAD-binding enzyme [Lachnospiraceae bacterium]
MKTVGIVGGGASGMMAAIVAAKNGAKVTILEKNDRVGKKILSTGNGRCNFSNLSLSENYYYTDDDGFLKKALNKFNNQDLIFFFTELGLLIKDKNGYLYPACEQASTVLDLLRLALSSRKVEVKTDAKVVSAAKKGNKFKVKTADGSEYEFDSLILSAGGLAGLPEKEKANGYDLCKAFDLKVTKLYPALTQLHCEGMNFKAVSGVKSDCELFLFVNDELVMKQGGEVLFTDYGISGIVSMQVSHYAAECLDAGSKVSVVLDLLPGFDEEALRGFIIPKLLLDEDKTAEEFFTGLLNKKLNTEIIKLNGLKPSEKIGNYSQEEIIKAVLSVKELMLNVTATNGFESAQVTGGGVVTSELSEDLESIDNKGLYVTGELVNVDGICGGYNLQWAFTSGYIAGTAASNEGKE